MKIERKIAIGYTIIVALIGGIVYTYLHEWRQMNRLEREVKEIHRLRQSVHEAYVTTHLHGICMCPLQEAFVDICSLIFVSALK